MGSKEWYENHTKDEPIRIRMSDLEFTYMETYAEYYHKEQLKTNGFLYCPKCYSGYVSEYADTCYCEKCETDFDIF